MSHTVCASTRWLFRLIAVAVSSAVVLGLLPVNIPLLPIGRPQVAEAAPSSNPGSMAFSTNRDTQEEIYFAASTEPLASLKRATNNAAIDRRPHISPDGQTIVFESNRDHVLFEIYAMPWDQGLQNYDETKIRRLTTNTTSDRYPKWSPDSRTIAYQCRDDGGADDEICLMDAFGGSKRRLTSNAIPDQHPSWSRDGHIAFSRRVVTVDFSSVSWNNMVIFRMNDDGSNVVQLTDPPDPDFDTPNVVNETEPYWSNDSFDDAWIAYKSDRSPPSTKLRKLRANTGLFETQIGSKTGVEYPSWTPSGARRVGFHTIDGATGGSFSDIFIADENGGNPQNLTQNSAIDRDATFCCASKSEGERLEGIGQSPNAPEGADPVNLASGNAAYSESDLVIATAGPSLALNRTHNNIDQRTRRLGPGWRTNFDQEITYTTGVIGSGDVRWTRSDGRGDAFAATGPPGVYTPTDGRHDALARYSSPQTHFVATDTANIIYRFNDRGELTDVMDQRGVGYRLERDAAGRLRDITHTLGPSIHLDYEPSGRLAQAVASDGRTVTYTHAGGRLGEVTKAGGMKWQYAYDAEGRLFEVKDPSGQVVYEADLFVGQIVGQRDGRGNGQKISYSTVTDLVAGATVRTDEFGRTLTDTWDSRGFATAAIDQEGGTTRYGYNSAGDRTEVTDAIGARWRTSYTPGGDPKELTNPIGAVSRADYRADHQPSTTTDPTGLTTSYSYDDLVATGTLTSVDPPGDAGATIYTPNPDGTIAAVSSPDGLVTRTEYDSQGRPVHQFDPADRKTTTNYNSDGTVTSVVGPDGAATHTLYDNSLRPARSDDPLGNATYFGYDAAGNQAAVTDTRGQVTLFGYDAAYNLVDTSTTIEGGQVIEARYGYDAANRLSAVTYPEAASGQASYGYSPSGRLVQTTDPDGAQWAYQYSGRGDLTESVAPNQVTTHFFYDAAGQLTSQQNEKEGTLEFEYDLAGRPLLVRDQQGRPFAYRTFSYDSAGRLIGSEDQAARDASGGSRAYIVTSTISPGGRSVRMTQGRFEITGPLPSDRRGESVAEANYGYNDDGTLYGITSDALVGTGGIGHGYDPVTGRLTSQSVPGSRASYQYDLTGRTTELTWTVAGGSIGFQTRYDAAGNVTELSGTTFSYDGLGRLKTAYDKETDTNWTYAYDKNSNRTSASNNKGYSQNLSFGLADKITTGGYAYDAAGRVISDTPSPGVKRHYIWDGYGHLSGIDMYLTDTGRAKNVRMIYDSYGRPVEKVTYLDLSYELERLFFHYDQSGRLLGEEDMTGTVREYLYAGGEAPTAMRARQSDGSYKNYFFVTNTHGDVVAVTDRDGNIVNRYAYGPWGESTRVSEQVHQPFRYAGYRYEDGFDLYYLRARWYDGGTGRFLSRDIERGSSYDLPSLNRYAYGQGSPASGADPTGHSPKRPKIGSGIRTLFPSKKCAARDMPDADWTTLAHTLSDYLIAGGAYPSLTSSSYRIQSDKELAKRKGIVGYWQSSLRTMTLDWGQNLCSLKRSGGLAVLIHETEHVDQNFRLGDEEFTRLYDEYDRTAGYKFNPLEDDAYCKEADLLGVLTRGPDVDFGSESFGGGGGAGFGRRCR